MSERLFTRNDLQKQKCFCNSLKTVFVTRKQWVCKLAKTLLDYSNIGIT